MRTDAALSAVIEKAIEDRDLDLIVDAMAEKVDLERALDVSRTESWNTWQSTHVGGAA